MLSGEGAETGRATTVETKTQNLSHTSQVLNPSPRSQSIGMSPRSALKGEHRCVSAWSRRWPTREKDGHGRDRRGPHRKAWSGCGKEEDMKTDLTQRK